MRTHNQATVVLRGTIAPDGSCQDLICILLLWTSRSLLQYTPHTSPLHTYIIHAYTQSSRQYIETPWHEGAPPSLLLSRQVCTIVFACPTCLIIHCSSYHARSSILTGYGPCLTSR